MFTKWEDLKHGQIISHPLFPIKFEVLAFADGNGDLYLTVAKPNFTSKLQNKIFYCLYFLVKYSTFNIVMNKDQYEQEFNQDGYASKPSTFFNSDRNEPA